MMNNDIVQSCKTDSKLNWVICEIAIPPKNQIGLFAKLRKILTYELITMVDATLSLLSLPEIRKIRQRLR